MKKRLFSMLLSIAMIIGMFPVISSAAKAKVVDVRDYNNAQEILYKLGAIDSYKEDYVNSEKITRYSFTHLMLSLYKNAGRTVTPADINFADVTPGTAAAEDLATAVAIGLIHGEDDGSFRPNDNITLNEAATIALNALGYGRFNDYRVFMDTSREARNEIIEGVASNDGYLTYADAYMLISNALVQDRLQISYISGKSGNAQYVTKDGDTLLKDLFGIEYVEGIMTANEEMHLKEDRHLPEKSYEIVTDANKVILFEAEGEYDYRGYMGMSIYAYYREESGRKVLWHVAETSDNEYLEISGENVTGYNASRHELEYDEEKIISEIESKKTEEEVKIPLSINIVYNSYYVYDNAVVFDRINKAVNHKSNLNIRSIRLVDNDKDDEYDVMFVNMYNNFLVEKVDSDKIAMDFYTKNTINLKGSGDTRMILRDADGNKIDPSKVAPKNVLSIEQDINGNRITNIYVTQNNTEGVLQGKVKKDGYGFIVNDETLMLANGDYYKAEADGSLNYIDYIKRVYDIAKIGESYTIYFDICGRVTGFNNSSSDFQYGYVLNAWADGTGERYMKICVPDDSQLGYTISKFGVKSKVTVDGSKQAEDNLNVSGYPYTLIRFKKNDNEEITVIDTPSRTRGKGEFSYMYEGEVGSPKRCRYRPNWSMLCDQDTGVGEININFPFQSDTTILVVPHNASVPYGEDRIARLSGATASSFFQDNNEYRANGFVLDGNDLVCDIMLVYLSYDGDGCNTESRRRERTRAMVVDSVSEAINHDGEKGVLIEGIERGERAAYVSSTPNMRDWDDETETVTINKGDIVVVDVNTYGDADHVKKMYNYQTDSYEGMAYSNKTCSNRVVIGSVLTTDDNVFGIVEKTKERTLANCETIVVAGDHRVYVYDKSSDKVRLGSYKDIVADPTSRFVMKVIDATMVDVVVYKDCE